MNVLYVIPRSSVPRGCVLHWLSQTTELRYSLIAISVNGLEYFCAHFINVKVLNVLMAIKGYRPYNV